MTEHEKSLVRIAKMAEEGDDALQLFWPKLECVLSTEVMCKLERALERLQHIQNDAITALGGTERYMKLEEEVRGG